MRQTVMMSLVGCWLVGQVHELRINGVSEA